jgi:hypothetical protein
MERMVHNTLMYFRSSNILQLLEFNFLMRCRVFLLSLVKGVLHVSWQLKQPLDTLDPPIVLYDDTGVVLYLLLLLVTLNFFDSVWRSLTFPFIMMMLIGMGWDG